MGMGDERLCQRSGIGAGDGDRLAFRIECNPPLRRAGLWGSGSANRSTAPSNYDPLVLIRAFSVKSVSRLKALMEFWPYLP